MKKKSLLILPVLLLALAACNKEEEEEIPADDTTTPTEPSDTGENDGGDGGDGEGGENTPELDARIIVTKEAVHFDNSNIMYENSSDLTIRSTAEDEPGIITYTLRGTASAMSTEQADEFWNGVAAEGDLFIVVTVSLEEGETVSWTTPDATTKSVAYAETENGDEDMIVRISGTSLSTEVAAGQITFTIADETAETSVDHIVDFSSVCQPAPVREPITTVPEGSIGVLDFSGIEKSSNSDQSADDLNALFAESWVPASDADTTSTGVVALDEEQGTTLPFEVTASTKVLLGAGGSATSGNTGNTHWQLSTQCIKLSNSPTASSGHVDGSFTLDFGETAVSKVEIEALAWSTTEEVTLDVAETVSADTPEETSEAPADGETSVKTITSGANDLEVETPEVLTWCLGEQGVNSITISATNRALIFSIAFWTVAEA